MELLTDRIPSPIGDIIIASDGEHLRALDFEDYEDRMHRLLGRYYGEVHFRSVCNPAGTSDVIRRYIDGDIEAIAGVSVRFSGSEFQNLCWGTLQSIPAGATWSYGELAAKIGKPAASRAVGLANGSNPIAIVVPCHRVIGADGKLTGYGGGIERKRWLLAHEGAMLL